MASLERLPTGLLEGVFVASKNCNLPLASRTLLAVLRGPSSSVRAVYGLYVEDCRRKGRAVGEGGSYRSYRDWPIYPSALLTIDIPERLLCGFKEEPWRGVEYDGGYGIESRFWKLNLLSRISIFTRKPVKNASLQAAAQRGLKELLPAKDPVGVMSFAIHLIEAGTLFHASAIKQAVVDMDCCDRITTDILLSR